MGARLATGLDIGSTTVKVVLVGPSGELVWSACERHRGEPRETLARLLARAPGASDVRGVTGSIGTSLAADLGARPVHEIHAVLSAVRASRPDVRTVVELGGQDAKLVLLDRGRHDAQMNDRCAAGTGASLDRLARRLELRASDVAARELEGELRVAARCGVFAETDAVNLLKRGADKREILSAIARAIVRSCAGVLARGRVPHAPVVLLGGPHAHWPILTAAWRELLAALWRDRNINSGSVEVPPNAELWAAVGAALHAQREGHALAPLGKLLAGTRREEPLALPERALAPLRARPTPASTSERDVLVGLDAGSTTTKAVLLSRSGRLLAARYRASAGNPVDDARACLQSLLRDDQRVLSLGVTGYGAALVAPALGADQLVVETLAHARAASDLGGDVIVDVGGTDAKVLRLEGTRVVGFHVSSQCAAGLGAFLASASEDLGVPIAELAERALGAARVPRFTVGCSVFADTDRVTFQREGYGVDELLAGLAWALARNVWEHVVTEPPARLGRRFVLTGGVHRNLAVAVAQARYLGARVPGAEVRVHPYPELCGAIGAALEAATPAASRFVGHERLPAVRAEARSSEQTRCRRCELECARTLITLHPDRRELVTGNACERGAEPESTAERTRAHAPDLWAEEAARLFRVLVPPPPPREGMPVIGVPRVMALYRSAPLLLHYLRGAGVPEDRIVLSPPTSDALFEGGAGRGVHDPCFPSKLVVAHVDWLARRHVELLFLPAITHAKIAVRGTADTASCPIVAACGAIALGSLRRDGRGAGVRALTPELCLVDDARLDAQLFETFAPVLGLDQDAHQRALAYARRAQQAFHDRCRRRGQSVLERARRSGRAVAVVLARPYHADPGVQHGLSTELAARGVPVMGLASLPIDGDPSLDVGDVLADATNSGAAERVWAARRVALDPHLVAVDLTSFRCGQDASVAGTIEAALARADRPALRLHDLDEDRPAVSLGLRIETFVALLRRYEQERLLARPAAKRASPC